MPINSTAGADLIRTTTGRACTRQNLEKMCKAGRLPRSCVSLKPIRLDPDRLVGEYLANVDPRQVGVIQSKSNSSLVTSSLPKKAELAPTRAVSDRQLREFIDGLPEDQIPDLNKSRARREHYQAEKAKLEALQGRGELVPAEEVKREAFAMGRQIRDAMQGIPDRVASLLAASSDVRDVHQMLTEEIRVALRGLADG
jgi:hypothetical protein